MSSPGAVRKRSRAVSRFSQKGVVLFDVICAARLRRRGLRNDVCDHVVHWIIKNGRRRVASLHPSLANPTTPIATPTPTSPGTSQLSDLGIPQALTGEMADGHEARVLNIESGRTG